MNQDTVTRELHNKAKSMGYYNDADIMRVQEDLVDSIILENLPMGTPSPQFESYLDKVNYIVGCKYEIK